MIGQMQSGPMLMPGDARYDGLAKEFASDEFASMVAGTLPRSFRFHYLHPIANLFPMLPEVRRADFRASLAEEGQHHAVTLHRGMVLDGRNRARELIELKKPISTGLFSGTDLQALNFVIAENLARRHLTESQRSMLASDLGALKLGANQHTRQPAPIGAPSLFEAEGAAEGEAAPVEAGAELSQTERADILSVSRRSVQRSDEVKEKGAPELVEAVRAGAIKVGAAVEIASLPIEEQRAIVAAADPKLVKEAAKKINKDKNDKRRTERSDEITRLANASKDLPTGQKFPLVYMDPPTKFAAGDSDRSTENHYPTMTEEEIAALPVSELALDKAVLLIWTTVPWLHKTLRLIEAWGFEYKSCACWDKETAGLGFWWQNQHELLIAASRGNPVIPENGSILGPSLYREKKTRHSAKPEYFRVMIDGVPEWKDWPKVELFPRGTLPDNWKGWGNEARLTQQQALGIETSEAAE